MSDGNQEHNDSWPEISHKHSYDREKQRPDYKFYRKGINQAREEWITTILAFIQKRTGGEVVVLVAILALWRIASELIKERSSLYGMTLAGCLSVATMIFTIGLLAMLRVTKGKHAEDTQENQSKTPQPGVSNECQKEIGTTP